MQLDKCFSHQSIFAECLVPGRLLGGEGDTRNSCKFLLRNLKSTRGHRSVPKCKRRQKRSALCRFSESICIIIPARKHSVRDCY